MSEVRAALSLELTDMVLLASQWLGILCISIISLTEIILPMIFPQGTTLPRNCPFSQNIGSSFHILILQERKSRNFRWGRIDSSYSNTIQSLILMLSKCVIFVPTEKFGPAKVKKARRCTPVTLSYSMKIR